MCVCVCVCVCVMFQEKVMDAKVDLRHEREWCVPGKNDDHWVCSTGSKGEIVKVCLGN